MSGSVQPKVLPVALVGAGLVALMASWPATPAAADNSQSPLCGERSKILDQLSEKYSEQPIAMGLSLSGAIVELLKAPSNSWTILLTRPEGPTCVLSAGEGWEKLPEITAIPGSPT